MTERQNQRPILIAGPTASGKSRLALRLAAHVGGAIINADSMQVYRDLRVLTARPTVAEEAAAPHLLYGFVPAAEAYSAGRYTIDVAGAIAQARREGLVPIIVGGTGLYFRVLLEGLSPVPVVDPDVRAYWREQAAVGGAPALHALLQRRDPEMAGRLMPTDPQRIVRALEVLDSTGRSLAHWQRTPGKPVLASGEATRLLVMPERAAQAAAIDRRFDAMMEEGAMEEVRALVAQGLSSELPAMRALGVASLMAHLAGRLTREEASTQAKVQTRQYAKRQATWLRRNMSAWKCLSTQQMESFGLDDLSFVDP